MTIAVSAPHRGAGWLTLLKLGLRELRAGLKGFKIFIACLALGVGVIAAVGSLADSMRDGFASQGAALLGGDMTFSRMHVAAEAAQREAFARLGTLSETATLRTMARRLDGAEQALIELKGADEAYPLIGQIGIERGPDFRAAIESGGLVADGMLLERLGVSPGDRVRIGEAEIEIKAILKSEPDAMADRLTYGPRVFVSLTTLQKTGLIKPGTLVKWRYAIKLAESGGGKDALKQLRDTTLKAFPQAGFTALDRYDPSPQITRTLERLRQFLVLIGLASLLVGGVGVANAVQTFIDKRIKVIATLRSIGATGREIMIMLVAQVLAMTAAGVGLGLGLGMLVPVVVEKIAGDALPVHAQFATSPASLALAAAYGVMIALIFALWPLGQTEHVRASVLFRDTVQPVTGRPRPGLVVITGALAAFLTALAALTSDPHKLALFVLGGLAVMLAVFSGLGQLIARLAQRAPRMKWPGLALAVRNAGAPDGLARSVIVSLGTGLSLLVAVALTNASLIGELQARLPDASPDYFLLDVPKQDYAALAGLVTQKVPSTILVEAPMLRGRLVAIKGTPVEEIKAPGDVQWVLNGDRGLSYAETVPEGSHVTQGQWWDKDYSGPPLVSFEGEIAGKLGLKIGDKVTVNVLGRDTEATIANLRDVKWQSLAINFVMVFSPNTLQGAPHNLLATIRLPKGTQKQAEVALVRDLAKTYPAVSAIRVRDALDQANKIFAKIMMAVKIAGSVTLAAGALVLAGALATAQRRRTLEAVILKTLGATRRQILTAHLVEYTLLAAVAAAVATALGTLVAWIVVTKILELTFVFSLSAVLQTLAVALGLILAIGGLGTYAVLRAPSVPYLRTE